MAYWVAVARQGWKNSAISRTRDEPPISSQSASRRSRTARILAHHLRHHFPVPAESHPSLRRIPRYPRRAYVRQDGLDYLVQDWRKFGRREGAQSLRAHVAKLSEAH
jgi:hypothetical protein